MGDEPSRMLHIRELPLTNRLPYFQAILDRFEVHDDVMEQAFGSHMHWGYWEDPKAADGTVADFARAADRLTERVCDAAPIKDGDHVLDAGCGFGGTIASLNQRFSSMRLVGLNIDERQLARARQMVSARPGNTVDFVEGDACALPFDDASFDVVLAVECIFHFPSRLRFFREVRRVLRPGGRLALCDFVPKTWSKEVAAGPTGPLRMWLNRIVGRVYGPLEFISIETYRRLAEQNGLISRLEDDITKGTLPTYPVVKRVLARGFRRPWEPFWITSGTEWTSRLGVLRYMVLSWQVA